MLKVISGISIIFIVIGSLSIFPKEYNVNSNKQKKSNKLSLKDCIGIALENNNKIKAAKEDINIASARKKQAESGYWPRLSLKSAYTIMDQDPVFVLPASKMDIPLNIPGLNVNLNGVVVPEQDVKLLDRHNLHGELDLEYPLYTGGKVQSLNKQAELGYNIAKLETKKTSLEVKYNVICYYYAVVLTQKLYSIGKDAVARLEATLSLTESLYKNGSGKVTKIDYLRNKVMVDQANNLLTEIKGKMKAAREALRFVLGYQIPADFKITETEIPFADKVINIDSIVSSTYQYNPDWSKINSAEKVYKLKIDEARSEYLPTIALFGSLNENVNSYNYGMVNKANKTLWTAGIGMELPIFSGFRTAGKVDEREAQLNKIQDQKQLLHDAIALQIKNACNDVKITGEQVEKILEAKKSAEENCSLNERAFQEDMVEAKDLIEAQIMESLVEAQYQNALYKHFTAQAKLNMLIGK